MRYSERFFFGELDMVFYLTQGYRKIMQTRFLEEIGKCCLGYKLESLVEMKRERNEKIRL